MSLLLPLALCTLAVCCGAVSPPEPVPSPSLLLSLACNSSYVLDIANSILQDINRDRKDGYVLSLNRVSDAREHRQEVYGQCKAIFYINKARRILYLPAYNCTLRPVSRSEISMMCPDCPSSSPDDLSDPRFLETATESLAKYNSKSPSKQYSLVKITKTSSQWVFGPTYFVEYLIKESCTKSQASSCVLQSPNSVPVGICHGSLREQDSEKSVSVTCDFFKSQAPTPRGENSTVNQRPVDLSKVEEPQQKNTAPTNSSAKAVPKGSVQYLPDLDNKPKGSQGTGPVEAFPVQLDLTTDPRGEPLDVSFLFLEPMEEKLVVLPFPSKEQHSAECPGPAQNDNPLILPP
ncbi:fetuin-B isoform X2 [Physeter macrocephalus]|uniref:Fetuin-B isoform X2 n=1 Tax=Physeter macrocephalus TaxID=9755 RepID=A0A2Y9SNI9_PHYMC|nr:fetuin-B isoform X2 [Physeter catodon]|eukprot:XP_023980211.1 fetuin-B isoform X2 [Physeter catodon]